MTQHKRLRRLAILAAGAMASTVLVGVADAAVPTAPTAAATVVPDWRSPAASTPSSRPTSSPAASRRER